MSKFASLSRSEFLAKVGLYAQWAPAAYAAFGKLAEAAFSDGALDNKEKELIAVGCAHVLRCPYCIDYHVGLATRAGASKEHIAEAVWVAVALGAGAAFAHAAVAFGTLDGKRGDYYARDASPSLDALAAAAPASYAAYAELEDAAFRTGALSANLKRLIAVGCAHNTRCAFSIEHHVSEALRTGIERPAIAEAVWVAVEMGAGACYGHAGLTAALMEE